MKLKDVIEYMVRMAGGNMDALVYQASESSPEYVSDILDVTISVGQQHVDDYIIDKDAIVILTGRERDY